MLSRMAKTNFKSVDEYLASLPPAARSVLDEVRSILRRALPDAEEVISYQIPAYRMQGGTVIYCAAWKSHWSLYPASGPLVKALGEEIAPYIVSKGTIRFSLTQPVPEKLVTRIATLRAAEVAAGKRLVASTPEVPQSQM